MGLRHFIKRPLTTGPNNHRPNFSFIFDIIISTSGLTGIIYLLYDKNK